MSSQARLAYHHSQTKGNGQQMTFMKVVLHKSKLTKLPNSISLTGIQLEVVESSAAE